MQRKILPLLLFSLLALTGCSCQQRLERLQRRCPDCFTQTTAHVRDTLTVPEKILSGSVPWAWLPSGDTVLLQNRDITLQLLLEGDSLKADVTVPPDTLYIDRQVTVPCPRVRQPPQPPAPRCRHRRRTGGDTRPLGHRPRSAPGQKPEVRLNPFRCSTPPGRWL